MSELENKTLLFIKADIENFSGSWNIWTQGIDFDLPGNGGQNCLNYLSLKQRLWETFLGLFITSFAFYFSKSPKNNFANLDTLRETWKLPFSRLILIICMSICYGMELTYKLATKQLIFMINPCHILCLLQLCVLSMNPYTKQAQNLFKIVINAIYLPISACIFPVTNTLFLPGEVLTFWLEHILLLLIPLYLLYENILQTESLTCYKFILKFYACYYIYNLVLVQPLSFITQANINNLLCPAISDPFAGVYYRLHTLWHQLVLIYMGGKLFALIGMLINCCCSKNMKTE